MTVKKYPGIEMNHIQAKVGKNQPRPSENPATNDCRADVAFCETLWKMPRPMKTKGHHPHGGVAKAMQRPATTLRACTNRLGNFTVSSLV
jgi:hypothetical protein